MKPDIIDHGVQTRYTEGQSTESKPMSTFPHHPLTPQAISSRMARPFLEVGTNDADYLINPKIDGKQVMCPFYSRWATMLRRCYGSGLDNPSYKGCTVCDEWKTFSNFRAWMVEQDWEGNELDKDILVIGNKVYGPETCLFVTRQINTMMQNGRRGKLLPGVKLCKGPGKKKFEARLNIKGKKTYLGYSDTEAEAHEVYLRAKSDYIEEVANEQEEPLKSALYRHADSLYEKAESSWDAAILETKSLEST